MYVLGIEIEYFQQIQKMRKSFWQGYLCDLSWLLGNASRRWCQSDQMNCQGYKYPMYIIHVPSILIFKNDLSMKKFNGRIDWIRADLWISSVLFMLGFSSSISNLLRITATMFDSFLFIRRPGPLVGLSVRQFLPLVPRDSTYMTAFVETICFILHT